VDLFLAGPTVQPGIAGTPRIPVAAAGRGTQCVLPQTENYKGCCRCGNVHRDGGPYAACFQGPSAVTVDQLGKGFFAVRVTTALSKRRFPNAWRWHGRKAWRGAGATNYFLGRENLVRREARMRAGGWYVYGLASNA